MEERYGRTPSVLSFRVVKSDRQRLASDLRRALARYSGGRFETSGSGGAGGMVFYVDPAGAQFYIGGFNPPDAERIVAALNLTLRLLERSGER